MNKVSTYLLSLILSILLVLALFGSVAMSIADINVTAKKAKALAEKMKDESITVSLKVGEGGKTFGSISSKEIAEEMKKQLGYDIDKKKIVLKEAIKSVGTHIVDIKLHTKVTAQISVRVAEGK